MFCHFGDAVKLFVISFIHSHFVCKLCYGRSRTVFQLGLIWPHSWGTILLWCSPMPGLLGSLSTNWWQWKQSLASCELWKFFFLLLSGVFFSPIPVVSPHVADQCSKTPGDTSEGLWSALFPVAFLVSSSINSSYLNFSEHQLSQADGLWITLPCVLAWKWWHFKCSPSFSPCSQGSLYHDLYSPNTWELSLHFYCDPCPSIKIEE